MGELILSPLIKQVGGGHYKDLAIQPIEYAMKNKLNYCQANVVKYTTRYADKGGKEDLLKAIHNLELLIEMEYGKGTERFRREATAADSTEVQGRETGYEVSLHPQWPPATD